MKNKTTLKSLIDSWKFDYVNSNITDENFPLPERHLTGYKLFHFGRYISSEDAIKEMEKEGYLPANVLELISWKDWNDSDLVVALGSVADVNDNRGVVCLVGLGSGRDLCLHWFGDGWGVVCRFLAVRNLVLKPSDTLNSPLTLGNFVSCPHCGQKLRLKK